MKPTKFELHTKQGFVFTLKPENIYCNEEPVLPDDYHPYNMRLWVIGHTYGAVCAVWATCEQNAFDNACNLNAIDCFLSEEQDDDNEELTPLGNASELFDLSEAFIYEVDFKIERDWQLLKAFARCNDNDTLDY